MATYYVAKTGSDDNAGTLAAPWLTLTHAASHLTAGDTLYIRVGTYVESVTFAVNGTATSRITIDSSGTATHYALGISASSTLLLVGTTSSQATVAASTVNFPQTDVQEIRDLA